jgi:spermidine synthase
MSKEWVKETLYNDVQMHYKNTKTLYSEQTEHQKMVLFENPTFGRILSLDGIIQVTLKDEYVYHEMMVHVPLFTLKNPEKVLIIGGGDGGIAREVLKHRLVKKVTMVEIDEGVVNFSKRYLPEISNGAFKSPRLDLKIADGAAYIANVKTKFDAIIVDSTDPLGPGAVLFTKEFYTNCRNALNHDGILVTQNGVPFMQSAELEQSIHYFNDLFDISTCYLATIPTYVLGQMAIGFATNGIDNLNLSLELIMERFKDSEIKTQYYTPKLHIASFALPAFIENIVLKAKSKVQ